jgi:hypothetical protein
MNRRTLGLVAVILVCVVTLFMTVAKQKGARSGAALSDSVYNPYPPGILPPDLNSEIDRVLREVDVIEGRALARWHGLQPPIRTGQPPVVRDYRN